MTSIVRRIYLDGQPLDIPVRLPNVAASPRLIHTGGVAPSAAGSGANTTPSPASIYFAEIYVPENVLTTGVALFNGNAVAGEITLGLYDGQGQLVGKSASLPQAGNNAYQRVPLARVLVAGTYYVAAQFSSTAARFDTHRIGAFAAGEITGQTYGVMPDLTLPTSFTANRGPIASLY